ncbi:hypothetical protein LPH50_09915 [Xylella taiwanensis]|uniref:hypothetical protein n=1 Tax=Xylella taiwanensis TaxID=1444770 RepID=UPI001E50C44A|nr:hypothetical protein [Xylella taiwanensis]UFN06460.1 hypothetical protein LPH42_09795 [Xylella taiwanensis]UFN15646.1 hypothetical protein LPH50_09915 [Xylella taiwanensis]UFN29129.1 hypothetical protein LPH46_09990 [Xylella taiwanensis]UFN30979.1 hypothetical protein LPH63_07685 [Xylella taiwanensis]UFN33588.1 hypothetical protein LPH40_09755 [Xylella taiwanensis]
MTHIERVALVLSKAIRVIVAVSVSGSGFRKGKMAICMGFTVIFESIAAIQSYVGKTFDNHQ